MELNNKRFSIKYTGSKNPLIIRIPLIPGVIPGKSQQNRLLTIDACSFKLEEIPVTQRYPLCPSRKSDVVKVLFNNGFGVYAEDGKRTKVLQFMDSRTITQSATKISKIWNLVGSPDAFVWSSGHELQIGFSNVLEERIDFNALGIEYLITLQVQFE